MIDQYSKFCDDSDASKNDYPAASRLIGTWVNYRHSCTRTSSGSYKKDKIRAPIKAIAEALKPDVEKEMKSMCTHHFCDNLPLRQLTTKTIDH